MRATGGIKDKRACDWRLNIEIKNQILWFGP